MTEGLTNDLVSPDQIAALAPILKAAGRTIESTMVGQSMTPTIPNGARIKIICDPNIQITTGTVVAYLNNRHPAIGHRVAGIGRGRRAQGHLVTRGDSRMLCDPPIDRDSVLGVVTAWEHDAQWIPVGPRPKHARWSRTFIERIIRSLMLLTLEIHPAIAGSLARWSLRVARMAPRRKFLG